MRQVETGFEDELAFAQNANKQLIKILDNSRDSRVGKSPTVACPVGTSDSFKTPTLQFSNFADFSIC